MHNFSQLLRSNGFISINKVLIRTLGLDKSMFLSHLFELHEYYTDNDMLIEGDKFFIKYSDWEHDTGQTEYTFTKCVKWAEKMMLIETKRQGIPAKKFYKLNVVHINAYLRDMFDPEKNPPRKRKKRTHIPTPSNPDVEHYTLTDDDVPPSAILTPEEHNEIVAEERKPVTPCENKSCENAEQVPRNHGTIYKDLKEDLITPQTPLAAQGGGSDSFEKEPPHNNGLLPKEVVTSKKPEKADMAPQTMQNPVKELSKKARNERLAAMSEAERAQFEEGVEKVIKAYKETKEQDQTRVRGKQRVRERLLDGWSLETLYTAIDRYFGTQNENLRNDMDCFGTYEADPQYFYGVGNFFGRDAHFVTYLDDTIDWVWRCVPPAKAQYLNDLKWYRHLRAQYKEAYGDDWRWYLHLRKGKTIEEYWEEEKGYYKDAEDELYGELGIKEDKSVCPGGKTYVRDLDEENDICQKCPIQCDCLADKKACTMDMRQVVDQKHNKWLKPVDSNKIANEQAA